MVTSRSFAPPALRMTGAVTLEGQRGREGRIPAVSPFLLNETPAAIRFWNARGAKDLLLVT
jgi:hypothetical protein